MIVAIAHDGTPGGGVPSADGRHLAVTVDHSDRDRTDAVRVYTLNNYRLCLLLHGGVT